MNSLAEQFAYAGRYMPGGVNSSVRVNNAIGTPFYASRGEGSRICDVAGKEYIDMCCAHGAGILGYKHPAVTEAVMKAAEIGFISPFETEAHGDFAKEVCRLVPCAGKVRFCSSGTEATMHLIRACRGYTGRNRIIRMEGHFHGYHEMIYIGGQPPREALLKNRETPYIESAGIPSEYAGFIIPVPFNDEAAIQTAVEQYGSETALIILEPVNYNSGGILPKPGYLELLRQLATEHGIILFFDEIQSIFKKSTGGAQQDFNVIPDVCTIGKALGGGLPLSGFCGKPEIMDVFKPIGPVQHSGTFNAHIVPILAGAAFVREAVKPYFYAHLRVLEDRFHKGMDDIINNLGLNLYVSHHGARFNFIFGRTTPPERYEDTFSHEKRTMLAFCRECFDRGVYFHDYGGSPAHHGYSVQHTVEDIDRVLDVVERALKDMKTKNLV